MFLNGKELQNLHIGDTQIQRVMKGDSLVWEGNKLIDLGSSNRYDLTVLYPDYQSLTNDNIFFLSFEQGYGVAYPNVWLQSGVSKNIYSGGLLICCSWVQNHEFPSHAVISTKPNLMKRIGVGQTFDIASLYPNSYQNYTEDNFLIKSITHNNYIYRGNEDSYDYIILEKTYDSSTGELICRVKDQGASQTTSWVRYSDCEVYFTPRTI